MARRISNAAAALAALWLSAAPVEAQGRSMPDEVQPGARVRVRAPGIVAGRYVGTVLTRSGDTVSLGSPAGAPFAVPLSRMSSLEVSRGKSRMDGALRGIAWGAPIGLGLAVVAYGLGNYVECPTCNDEPSRAEGVALITLSGAVWGAGLGAIIGRERWERFQLAPRAALGAHHAGRNPLS